MEVGPVRVRVEPDRVGEGRDGLGIRAAGEVGPAPLVGDRGGRRQDVDPHPSFTPLRARRVDDGDLGGPGGGPGGGRHDHVGRLRARGDRGLSHGDPGGEAVEVQMRGLGGVAPHQSHGELRRLARPDGHRRGYGEARRLDPRRHGTCRGEASRMAVGTPGHDGVRRLVLDLDPGGGGGRRHQRRRDEVRMEERRDRGPRSRRGGISGRISFGSDPAGAGASVDTSAGSTGGWASIPRR